MPLSWGVNFQASCEGFVNPCKTENGGCNTEPYTSCQVHIVGLSWFLLITCSHSWQAVDCNGEVVCQKAVAAETDEVESSMIEENKLYIAAGGGVLFAGLLGLPGRSGCVSNSAGVGAMFLMKKKKKY